MTDKGLSMTEKGFSMTEKGLSMTERPWLVPQKVRFEAKQVVLMLEPVVFEAKRVVGAWFIPVR